MTFGLLNWIKREKEVTSISKQEPILSKVLRGGQVLRHMVIYGVGTFPPSLWFFPEAHMTPSPVGTAMKNSTAVSPDQAGQKTDPE